MKKQILLQLLTNKNAGLDFSLEFFTGVFTITSVVKPLTEPQWEHVMTHEIHEPESIPNYLYIHHERNVSF